MYQTYATFTESAVDSAKSFINLAADKACTLNFSVH
jgi:hypothetical protein